MKSIINPNNENITPFTKLKCSECDSVRLVGYGDCPCSQRGDLTVIGKIGANNTIDSDKNWWDME